MDMLQLAHNRVHANVDQQIRYQFEQTATTPRYLPAPDADNDTRSNEELEEAFQSKMTAEGKRLLRDMLIGWK
jgi:hypothetical protein